MTNARGILGSLASLARHRVRRGRDCSSKRGTLLNGEEVRLRDSECVHSFSFVAIQVKYEFLVFWGMVEFVFLRICEDRIWPIKKAVKDYSCTYSFDLSLARQMFRLA